MLNSVEALGEILHRICAIASSTTHVICLQCFYIAIFCLAISPILFSNYNSELHLMRFSFLSIGGQFFNVFFSQISNMLFSALLFDTHKITTFVSSKTRKRNKYFQTKSTQKFSKLYNTEHSNARTKRTLENAVLLEVG